MGDKIKESLEKTLSRRKFLAAIGAVGAGAALGPLAAACSTAAPAAAPTAAPAAGGSSAQKVVIKLGHHHTVDSQVDKFAKKFAELVAQKTNGQAEVQIFPGAQLGQEAEAVEGVHLGTLQMTIGSSPFLDKYSREQGVEQLPFMFDDWDHAQRCMKGPVAAELA